MTARAVDYLRVPEDYGRKLGGVRWANTGEAIEFPDGATFALAPELALFVSGFAAKARLIHFTYVLHAFALLWKSRTDEPGLVEPDERLRETFARTGRRLRNAGAFFAHLTESLPRTAVSFDPGEVCRMLARSTSAAADIDFVDDAEVTKGKILDAGPEPTEHLRNLLSALEAATHRRELPPLAFASFETLMRTELAKLDQAMLESWLRYGEPLSKGPAATIAEAVLPPRPSLADVLAETSERPRLGGSIPLVAHLVSALTLPPRRLAVLDLPLGGYSDVTTRGQFEQVLPFQLALDELELVRRFASNELLFFRREEPQSRIREELVVVADQGARTWGPVRVILGAAALALGKLAGRRGTGCLYAGTSNEGDLVDPTIAGASLLGELIEASDLTLEPGVALEHVLESKTDAARDVVLLTHPRALLEKNVLAAARRAHKPLRLFAVSADETGVVELSELRHGAPVTLARLRVDLTPATAPAPKPVAASAAAADDTWRGDVESVPFPFVFGPTATGFLGPRAFDFDPTGAWLLVAGRKGLLFAYRTDATHAEVWPRASVSLHQRSPLQEVSAVIGVSGGFAVCGRVHSDLVVAHYDLASRRCRTHVIARHEGIRWSWLSFPHLHSIAVRRGEGDRVIAHALDLGTGELAAVVSGEIAAGAARASVAVMSALNPRFSPPPPELSVQRVGPGAEPRPDAPGVIVNGETGRLLVGARGWNPFQPLDDGMPFLQKCKPSSARLRGEILALATWDEGPITQGLPLTLRLFRRDGSLRGVHELASDQAGYQLAHDGKLLARETGNGRVEVRTVDGGAPVLATTPGRFHDRLEVILGDQWLAIELPARLVHIVRWDGEQLLAYPVSYAPGNPTTFEAIVARELAGVALREPGLRAKRTLPGWIASDPARWAHSAEAELTAIGDRYGHICLFDSDRKLIAMLFVWRREIAVWMPDGTRLGSPKLTGRPPTPDARRKVALALREATVRGRTRE